MARKDRFRFYALKLCGWMLLVFLMQLMFDSFTDLFLLNSDSYIEIWRFLTAIFLHGGFAHLLYNTFALAFFGSMLERFLGSKRFLMVFFVTGLLANIVSVNFYNSSLGASGAIFGVIGALVAIRPLMFVWAFGFPMPLFIAGIIWAAGDLIGLFVPSNVANLAHLSGMFFGLILGFIYHRKVKDLV
ncbi:MAG: rhomboid family intramembrane serine protease [Nanoarchaeota archaeon]